MHDSAGKTTKISFFPSQNVNYKKVHDLSKKLPRCLVLQFYMLFGGFVVDLTNLLTDFRNDPPNSSNHVIKISSVPSLGFTIGMNKILAIR